MTFTSFILKSVEYFAPFTTLTSLSAKLTDKELGWFTQFLIRNFIKTFDINLEEIKEKDLHSYKTFNDFFIRELADGERTIDKTAIAVSPVDGTIGECGNITQGRLIQAKGLDYSLKALVGGDLEDSKKFEDGLFSCIYLSPANYHRIHMPLDGTLVKTIHVPGKLFPVGKKNISHMPDLYTANERLVCIFDTAIGPFAVIYVGAALVGSIHSTWDGDVVRRNGLQIKHFDKQNAPSYKKGDEIGYFKYGSTVICIAPKDSAYLASDLKSGLPVQLGRPLLV